MSKDINTSNLAGMKCCQSVVQVPVMKGQLNKTIRKAKIKSDECSL